LAASVAREKSKIDGRISISAEIEMKRLRCWLVFAYRGGSFPRQPGRKPLITGKTIAVIEGNGAEGVADFGPNLSCSL
jgi:hypothetical protein